MKRITDGPEGEYITDRLTDEAIAFLEAHRDEPFFLNLSQYGLHGPWGHREAYTAKFATKTDPRGEQRNPIMAAMIQSVDESLGRILDKLDELLTEFRCCRSSRAREASIARRSSPGFPTSSPPPRCGPATGS